MKVLLTGATGYIGRRLRQVLEKDDSVQMLRLFVRDRETAGQSSSGKVETAEGDTFNINSLKKALDGIDTAYYLIHSMGSRKGDFADLDRISAENFLNQCIDAGVKRIIYLGGLGGRDSASKHLRSRTETGEILCSEPDRIETVWLRAGIIIGSGGASFEIIRNLVQKLPFLIAPAWVRNRTEPIAVEDVLAYLSEAGKIKINGNLTADIGSEVISFRTMLEQAAEVFGLRRKIIPAPFFSPRLSSYWLILITPVPFRIASALVEGLKSETVKQNKNAEKYFPRIRPLSYRDSLIKAMEETERDEIISRWCDSSGDETTCAIQRESLSGATFSSSVSRRFSGITSEEIWKKIISIGGAEGWLSLNFLWKTRGIADKISGGAGLNRGRRAKSDLKIGEALDFWKVIDLVDQKRLLLLSEMKMPGKGWLDFKIEENSITISSYFIPRGLLGRIYWHLLHPLHNIIFKNMLRQLTKK